MRTLFSRVLAGGAAPLVAYCALFTFDVQAQANPLQNLPVTQAVGQVVNGTLTITNIALEQGQLVADGVLRGTVNGQRVRQEFDDIPVALLEAGDPMVCDILFLDIGPIFLDLLGLQVDLSQITLDIDAVAGPGNLVGNLLCAVAGLLD
jgi:hypothetical protein